MKFYCIIRTAKTIGNLNTYQFLKEAAEKQGLEFITLEADNFDYANGFEAIEEGAIVYRLAVGERASMLELLLKTKKHTIGLTADTVSLLARQFNWSHAMRMEAAGVPIIPTIFNVSKNEDTRLKDYVETLGGFPIIVKSSGGSHGEGVMKIDSLESLRSVMGFISDEKTSGIALRKFVNSARHIRLVVLGGKVIDTIEYSAQKDDFRTNAVSVPSVVPRNDISEEIKAIAAHAVDSLGIDFAGVDVLIDKDGSIYVAEANSPCNFARNQMTTGTDIGSAIVSFLVAKKGA